MVPTLQNPLVMLSPLSKESFERLLEFALQEPELWTYSIESAAGAEGLHQYIMRAIDQALMGLCIPFEIYCKTSQQSVGSTRFYQIDWHNRSLMIGYTWIGRRFQGTGINLSCKYLMLEYAFEVLGIREVRIRVDTQNTRSNKAVMKVGFDLDCEVYAGACRMDGSVKYVFEYKLAKEKWTAVIREYLQVLCMRGTHNAMDMDGQPALVW